MPPVCHSPGFSEAVIGVSDLDQWVNFLTTVFQWEVVHEGPAGAGTHDLWCLPQATQIHEILLRDSDAETTQGKVRLVKFGDVAQQQARPNAYAWDTGGFFDLHVQVHDVRRLFEDMQSQGWHGYTEPKRLDVSGVVIDEVLIHGPDGMAFALIERVSPPFQVVEGYRRVSPAWNAPQIVAYFTSAYRFYAEGLGFKPTIEIEMPPPEDGDTLFGLPLNIVLEIATQLAFFHPTGQRCAIGSVDLLHLVGLKGRDLSQTTRPPNLGLLLLRFPVKGLEDYATAIQAAGVNLIAGPIEIDIHPLGRTVACAVRSQEGAILEFYESSET